MGRGVRGQIERSSVAQQEIEVGGQTNETVYLSLPCSLLFSLLNLTENKKMKSNNRVIITTTMNFHNKTILIF